MVTELTKKRRRRSTEPVKPPELLKALALPEVSLVKPTEEQFSSAMRNVFPQLFKFEDVGIPTSVLNTLDVFAREDTETFLQDIFERGDIDTAGQLFELLGLEFEDMTTFEVLTLGFEQVILERQTEEAVTAIFPGFTPDQVVELANEDIEAFIDNIADGGYTPEKELLLKELGFSKVQVDVFFGVDQPQVTSQIPAFDDWVTEKGFVPAEMAERLRELGFAEELIPELIEQNMAELRAIYEYENNLGRWGTALGELDKIFISEPERIPSIAKVLVQSLLKLPEQTFAAILQAVQGQGGASVVDKDWADRFIEGAQEDIAQFTKDIAEQYPNSQLMTELAALSGNLGFSVVAGGTGLVVGVPVALLPVPGARPAAYAAGTTASGFVAYQMSTYQIMQEYLEFKDAEKRTQFDVGLTQFEEDALKEDFHRLAVKFGLWEAIPEALSNLAFFSILTAPLTSMVGSNAATQIISKIAGIYGQELLTETITQKGQARIEFEAGLREEDIGWVDSFKEIAPQTFLLTTVMAGAGQVIISSKSAIDKAKKSLTEEIGMTHPQFESLTENIENNLDDAVRSEPVEGVPDVTLEVPTEVEPVAEVPVVGEVTIPEVTTPESEIATQATNIQETAQPEVINETVPETTDDNVVVHDVSIIDRFRPSRFVFEKMGLTNIWQSAFKAETLLREEHTAFAKELNKHAKAVGKDTARRELVWEFVNNSNQEVFNQLTFEEKQAANWWKRTADNWADRLNIPQERRIKNYIPHIFDEQARQMGDIPLDASIAMILSKKISDKVNAPFLKKRLGKEIGLVKDPFLAAQAYENMALRIFYYEPILQKLKLVAEHETTPEFAGNYLKEYSKRMTGQPANIDREINAFIREIANNVRGLPGGERLANFLDRGNPSGMVAYNLTSALYVMWLGFKPTSAIRNLSQHGLIISEVDSIQDFGNGIRLRFTKEGKSALAESLVVRSRRGAFIESIDSSVVEGATANFRESALFLFRKADEQNVKDAFLSGYAEAKRLYPEVGRDAWIKRGDEVAADTQYLYTKMNSLAISQSGPGKVGAMLTTWAINWLELMNKFVRGKQSRVYAQLAADGKITPKKKNWLQSRKSLLAYMTIVAIAYGLNEQDWNRLRAFEYSGFTSIRTFANLAGGEFPGLQLPGAVADIISGTALGDERSVKTGWNKLKGAFSILNQLEDVASGEKDWLNLLFYLEGKDHKVRKLKEDWEKNWEPYDDLSNQIIRGREFPTLSLNTAQKRWREQNPKIEAQMFVTNRLGRLSSDEARAEVLKLIDKHNIDIEVINGYEKIFGVDTTEELSGFQKRIGNLEKLTIGEEAKYFTTGTFLSELNKIVKQNGRDKVERDGHEFSIFALAEQDTWQPYEDYDPTTGARLLYRQQNPDVEASLYLFGKIRDFQNPESAKILLDWMDKYNIPPQAVLAFNENPDRYDELFTQKFELEQKNFDLTTQYDNFGNTEASNYLADSEERRLAREKFKEDNPEWVADMRRIEAIDNNASDVIIGKWVDRGATIDEFGSSSSQAKVWLIDNPEVHTWALDNKLLTEDGSDWNEDILRINVQLDKLDSESNEFRKLNYRKDAFSINIPRDIIDSYVNYYTIPPKPDDWLENVSYYEEEWFLQDNPELHQALVDSGNFNELRDLSKVPMRDIFKKWWVYNTLTNRKDKDDYRLNNPDLDEWGVSVEIWTKTMTEQRRRKGISPTERFLEDVSQLESAFDTRQKEIDELIEGLR
ncbi:hypothetical protein LCGC14_0385130 [marine sediment metagenome]|uniref:Uncharacterized protein n=1 Tax=marine sediment metagenome TaxID=412755 RepID=A0A0F9VNF1_9ZZZZ